MRLASTFVPVMLIAGASTAFSEEAVKITFETPEGWGGETLKLPPGFARDMKVKGLEEIRFAPGMFKPDSESFFSYAFVFWLPGDEPLESKTIHSEIMTYYRGLASAVSRGEIKTDDFEFELKPLETNNAAWLGTLKWIEPFRTRKAQTLRFEISLRQLKEPAPARLLSIAVSPQDAKHDIWKDLRKILKSAEFKATDAAQ